MSAPSFDRMAFHRALRERGMRMRQPMHIHRSIGSTSAEARRLAESGAPSGTLVIAGAQTAGRGRGANRWISPEGRGLYMSLLLRPGEGMPPAQAEMSLLLGAAAAEAVREATAGRVKAGVKWPNDLMAGGRKLGGLLLEAVSGATEKDSFLIAGMGINVSHGAEELEGTEQPATSLALELGGEGVPSRETLLAFLCSAWEAALEAWGRRGFAEVEERWERFSVHERGERLSLNENGQSAEGAYEGIAQGGALVLRMDSGTLRQFVAGQARKVRPVPAPGAKEARA